MTLGQWTIGWVLRALQVAAAVVAAGAAVGNMWGDFVAEFRAGRDKAFNALVGKVMAASKGKANPAQVNAVMKRKLGARVAH